jgi:DNA-binding CsgD family transcriptional regulator
MTETATQPTTAEREAELVRYVGSLCTSASLEELQQRFVTGFPRVVDAPMYGYDLVDPATGRLGQRVTVNVSDAFMTTYERDARDVDPILARAIATGRPAYNRALMSAEEWEETSVYRRAYRMHRIRHVVEVPIVRAERIRGCLHLAASDRDGGFGLLEIALAEAVARVLADTVERLDAHERLERERDEVLSALDLVATPIVTSDAQGPALRLNVAARRLLADVVDAEERLHELLARPAVDGAFSRRTEVELAGGEHGVLRAASTPRPHDQGGLVAVLDLRRHETGIAPGALAALTPREADVAVLVVDGLADREIAERLFLSHHTVSQYVKRIYRKLDVDSRVALTRLLLGARPRGALVLAGQ